MYNNELIIDQVTEIMAVFAWETSRMIDQMSLDQKKFVRSMLNKYQIYVITEPGYKRKDQKKRVKELTKDTIGLYSSDYRNSSQFHSLTEKSLNKDFMKLSNNSFEKSDDAFIPKGVAVMGFKNKTHNVKFSMNCFSALESSIPEKMMFLGRVFYPVSAVSPYIHHYIFKRT